MIANIPIQAVLPASDIERARRWYSEKLGLEPVSTSPLGDLRYEAGGVESLVYQSELAGTNQATAAGFSLENFDEVVAYLRSNGVAFEHVDFGEIGATVDGVITTPDGRRPPGSRTARATFSPCRCLTDRCGSLVAGALDPHLRTISPG